MQSDYWKHIFLYLIAMLSWDIINSKWFALYMRCRCCHVYMHAKWWSRVLIHLNSIEINGMQLLKKLQVLCMCNALWYLSLFDPSLYCHKQGIVLVTVKTFKCPYSHWDKEFHICKPRSSANYRNNCKNLVRSNTSRCFGNKTSCWNLDSHKKMCRMKKLLSPSSFIFQFSDFLCKSISFSFWLHVTRYSFQQHFKIIEYVTSYFYILGSLCSPSKSQTISHLYLPKARMTDRWASPCPAVHFLSGKDIPFSLRDVFIPETITEICS